MERNTSDMICFSSIKLLEPKIKNNNASVKIFLNKIDNDKSEFILKLKYEKKLKNEYLSIIRLAFCIPLLNYGLFTKKFILNFSISKADVALLNKLNKVFSRDIFVNKILCRRTNYILPEYIPNEKKVKTSDAEPKSVFQIKNISSDKFIAKNTDNKSCGVLSSGGKDSLLTYGLLK